MVVPCTLNFMFNIQHSNNLANCVIGTKLTKAQECFKHVANMHKGWQHILVSKKVLPHLNDGYGTGDMIIKSEESKFENIMQQKVK